MKRFTLLLAASLVASALSIVPAFAQDSGQPPADQPPADPAAWCAEHPADPGCQSGSTAIPPPADTATPPPADTSASNSGSISTPVALADWFTSAQLSLLSVEEQKTLADKLNALASDPVAFKKKVEKLREWLSERLKEQKDKMENQAQWEAKQKAKFEAKVDSQFAKLMREKKEAMERARRMEEKNERIKRMKAKKARLEAARAHRFSKPKVFQAHVASVDTVNGVIVLKKNGAQAKVLVTAKTVLAVIEDDGARVGTLADFQAGDRIFGLVRRNPNNHALIGVVVVKMQARDADDDDEDEALPEAPEETPETPQEPPAEESPAIN